jgi:hypothetical protein
MPQEMPLHAQKVAILSRLIKESSLTLEEALLILKEEEVESTVVSTPGWSTGTTTPWTVPIQPYGTINGNPITFTTSNSLTGSMTTTSSTRSFTADLDLNN